MWARSWGSGWARRRGRWTGPRCRRGSGLAWGAEALEATVGARLVLSHHDHNGRPRRHSLADGRRLGEDDTPPFGIGDVLVPNGRNEPRPRDRLHRVLFGHAGHIGNAHEWTGTCAF